jgi:hypothetical protein
MGYDFPPAIANLSLVEAVKVLILSFTGGTGTIPTSPGIPIIPGGGTARTITSSAVTASGSVAAGAKSVAFQTSSDWSGSVNGAARAASQTFYITVPNAADTLPAIPYVRTGGTLNIDVLT